MLKDEYALEVFKEYYNQKCTYESECRILERRFAKEERKLGETEERLLDEHALVVRGQRLKNRKGGVWLVHRCYIDWASNQFTIKYHLELERETSYYDTIPHHILQKGFEEGFWSFAKDTDKTLARTTKLVKLIKNAQPNADSNIYIGFTAKGKCIVFSSWDKGLHKYPSEKWRIFRNSRGTYDLKAKQGFLSFVDIVGVYEDYRELTTEYLI
jgi:hypothetical protein